MTLVGLSGQRYYNLYFVSLLKHIIWASISFGKHNEMFWIPNSEKPCMCDESITISENNYLYAWLHLIMGNGTGCIVAKFTEAAKGQLEDFILSVFIYMTGNFTNLNIGRSYILQMI